MIRFIRWIQSLVQTEPTGSFYDVDPKDTVLGLHLRIGLTRRQLARYYQHFPNGHAHYLTWLHEVVEHYEMLRPLTDASTDDLAEYLDRQRIPYRIERGLCYSEFIPSTKAETFWLRLPNGLYVMGMDIPGINRKMLRQNCFYPEHLWEMRLRVQLDRDD